MNANETAFFEHQSATARNTGNPHHDVFTVYDARPWKLGDVPWKGWLFIGTAVVCGVVLIALPWAMQGKIHG